jgi:hypothetical protein
MLNSYVPIGLVICFIGAVVLNVYIPWWMWLFAVAYDAYTINETREWRRAGRLYRVRMEEVDRLTSETVDRRNLMASASADKAFAAVVTTLEALQSSWERATDDSERERIKDSIQKTMSELTKEQLGVYGEYQKERCAQAEYRLNESKNLILDLEAELNKRREEK